MNNITRCFIAGFVIALLVAVWLFSQSAGMFAMNTVTKQDWSDLEVQLQRRNDLIPDLISAVKAYVPDGESIFTAVTDAQGKLTAATTPAAKAEADAELTAALGRLLALAGSHPELATDETFFHLQKDLDDVEWAIDDAGKNYNEHVDLYNMCIDSFPASSLASLAGLTPREKFELPTAAPAGESATGTESE